MGWKYFALQRVVGEVFIKAVLLSLELRHLAHDEWAHLDHAREGGGWAEQLRNLPTIADVFITSCKQGERMGSLGGSGW